MQPVLASPANMDMFHDMTRAMQSQSCFSVQQKAKASLLSCLCLSDGGASIMVHRQWDCVCPLNIKIHKS